MCQFSIFKLRQFITTLLNSHPLLEQYSKYKCDVLKYSKYYVFKIIDKILLRVTFKEEIRYKIGKIEKLNYIKQSQYFLWAF